MLKTNGYHAIVRLLFLFILIVLNSSLSHAQTDACTSTTVLTSSTTCINTAGNLTAGATYSTIPVLGCGTAEDDVWYRFTAASNSHTVTLSTVMFANPQVQLFSGTCGALTSIACGTTSVTSGALVPGNTYYIRIYSSSNAAGTFNICITHSLNDLCSGVIPITTSPTCNSIAGTLTGATYTAGGGVPGCGAANLDVWYSFVANSVTPVITVTHTSGAGLRRSELFSGTCGALTSLACSGDANNLNATGLTIGQTYFVRVYSNNASAYNYTICVTDAGTAANDLCAGSVLLTSSTSCVNTAGNIYSGVTGYNNMADPDCSGAVVTADVWYRFVAQTINPTITISSLGSEFTNPGLQLLSASNCTSTFTSLFCGTTGIAADFLTPGTTYYIRVYKTGAIPNGATNAGFNICITDPVIPPPFNDECVNAVNLPIWNTCNNIAGNMAGATPSAVPLGGTCTGPLVYDTWYKFTSINTTATITLSSLGANFTNARIEVLSGSCGSLTSIDCGVSPLNATGLSPNTVYYVRVYSTAGSSPNGNAGFRICATTTNAPVRHGSAYVNVTKKTTGGVVETGDILEIRMTISHSLGTKYNMRFVDNLPSNTAIAPPGSGHDSLWIRTNEGLTYKRYTYAAGDDAGTYVAAPLPGEYNLRLNLGFGGTDPGIPANNSATEFLSADGVMVNTNNPRAGGSLLFSIAYRVVVTGVTGDTILLNPTQFLYKGSTAADLGPDTVLTATPYKIVISDPLSLCTNSVGINNAAEFGGTFGTATSLNRSTDLTDPIDRYTFVSDVSANTNIPDGRYAILKNISPRSGINRNARQIPNCGTGLLSSDPLHCANKMFNGHWYVDGDHTGTTNAIGNIPPGPNTSSGYMLLVNADYVASEVYRQTITNLCPNTYYEFSAWVRNVCRTCGSDSVGQQFTGTPTAPANGYPGVYPNLAFLLNDIDIYNTGEIDTVGWVKKGFVFRTGASQTSATFSIRNNAQGGGGNDWALDDIAIATCLPNMMYSPTNNPIVCESNSIIIYDTISSYYDNYTHYKWQRSTDGGTNWVDIAGATGTGTPVWNGSAYVYVTSYTIPPAFTTAGDDGDLYRVIVGTTLPNISDINCQFSDPVSITLDVLTDCGPVLAIDLLSVSGRLTNNRATITWVTSKEDQPVHYAIEKSEDGRSFTQIGIVNGNNNPAVGNNTYHYTDPSTISDKVYYRVVVVSNQSARKYSRIIPLVTESDFFSFISVLNPFFNELQYEVSSPVNGFMNIDLIDAYGKIVRSESQQIYAGTNSLNMYNTGKLAAGTYLLRASLLGKMIVRRVVKK